MFQIKITKNIKIQLILIKIKNQKFKNLMEII